MATKQIVFGGVIDSIAGWARRLGISKQAMQQRLEKWPVDVAIYMGGSNQTGTRRAKRFAEKSAGERYFSTNAILTVTGREPKVDGLADIIATSKNEIIDGLFSNEEQQRIAAIKARRKNESM